MIDTMPPLEAMLATAQKQLELLMHQDARHQTPELAQRAASYAAIVASLTTAINCPEPPASVALARRHTADCAKWEARARAAEEKLKYSQPITWLQGLERAKGLAKHYTETREIVDDYLLVWVRERMAAHGEERRLTQSRAESDKASRDGYQTLAERVADLLAPALTHDDAWSLCELAGWPS